MSLNDVERSTWSDLLLVMNCTYQLMVGMKERLLVDIPLRAYLEALMRLKDSSEDATTGLVFSSLIGLAGTYRTTAVGAPILMDRTVSNADQQWTRRFNDFVDDELYRDYCLTKIALGWPNRIEFSLERLWVLSKRLARTTAFKSSLTAGQKVVKVSTGLPADAMGLDDPLFVRENYLPPIVSLSRAMRKVQKEVFKRNGDALLALRIKDFEWYTASLSLERSVGNFSLNREWFVGLYTFSGVKNPTTRQYSEVFNRWFTNNLLPPYLCPVHMVETSIEDVTVEWRKKEIEIRIESCCEDAMQRTFAQMAADKNAE